MRIWLVHGFNVMDGGRGTIDQLIPFLEKDGHEVLQFDYGWTFLFGARLGNKGRAKKLAKLIQLGDVAIGHSNGCAIIHRASHLSAPFKQIVYISPALDGELTPSWITVRDLSVYYSPSDNYVRKANYIPFVIWGDMGATGCTRKNKYVHNFDKDRLLGTEVGHSKVFKPLYCRRFYNHLSKRLHHG